MCRPCSRRSASAPREELDLREQHRGDGLEPGRQQLRAELLRASGIVPRSMSARDGKNGAAQYPSKCDRSKVAIARRPPPDSTRRASANARGRSIEVDDEAHHRALEPPGRERQRLRIGALEPRTARHASRARPRASARSARRPTRAPARAPRAPPRARRCRSRCRAPACRGGRRARRGRRSAATRPRSAVSPRRRLRRARRSRVGPPPRAPSGSRHRTYTPAARPRALRHVTWLSALRQRELDDVEVARDDGRREHGAGLLLDRGTAVAVRDMRQREQLDARLARSERRVAGRRVQRLPRAGALVGAGRSPRARAGRRRRPPRRRRRTAPCRRSGPALAPARGGPTTSLRAHDRARRRSVTASPRCSAPRCGPSGHAEPLSTPRRRTGPGAASSTSA